MMGASAAIGDAAGVLTMGRADQRERLAAELMAWLEMLLGHGLARSYSSRGRGGMLVVLGVIDGVAAPRLFGGVHGHVRPP